jgi:hypothetical protein
MRFAAKLGRAQGNKSLVMTSALCRLSTGGGFATPALYQNRDEEIFEARMADLAIWSRPPNEPVPGRPASSWRTTKMSARVQRKPSWKEITSPTWQRPSLRKLGREPPPTS